MMSLYMADRLAKKQRDLGSNPQKPGISVIRAADDK